MNRSERKQRQAAQSRAHYLANKAAVLERAAEWRQRHPERMRAMRKKYTRTRWGRRARREQQWRYRERLKASFCPNAAIHGRGTAER
jgi:hypothetical protein